MVGRVGDDVVVAELAPRVDGAAQLGLGRDRAGQLVDRVVVAGRSTGRPPTGRSPRSRRWRRSTGSSDPWTGLGRGARTRQAGRQEPGHQSEKRDLPLHRERRRQVAWCWGMTVRSGRLLDEGPTAIVSQPEAILQPFARPDQYENERGDRGIVTRALWRGRSVNFRTPAAMAARARVRARAGTRTARARATPVRDPVLATVTRARGARC